MKNKKIMVTVTGGIMGLLAIVLVKLGNPPNMGYCIACFLRDISGGIGLHRAEVVQYLRPEIFGLIIGAFFVSLFTKEHKATGGSSPFIRFTLAFIGMIGMLVFLGCPVRLVLRLAGGDLNAVVGLLGLIVGVVIGIQFLKQGFTLGKNIPINKVNGYIFPVAAVVLLVLVMVEAPFLFFSTKGPGSMHAPLIISIIAGLLVGIFSQRSRFCMIGGIRDFILFRDTHLLYGFFSLLIVAFIGNLVLGAVNFGFTGQPVAHSDGLWNFLGMVLAGWVSVLLGGCPLRQLVAASEGNSDCAITILGFMAGAAVAHNFGLAASPKGVSVAGQYATIIGLLVVLGISYFTCRQAVTGGVRVGSSS